MKQKCEIFEKLQFFKIWTDPIWKKTDLNHYKVLQKNSQKKIVLEIDKHLRSVNVQTMLQLRNKEILQNCGLLQLDMN